QSPPQPCRKTRAVSPLPRTSQAMLIPSPALMVFLISASPAAVEVRNTQTNNEVSLVGREFMEGSFVAVVLGQCLQRSGITCSLQRASVGTPAYSESRARGL